MPMLGPALTELRERTGSSIGAIGSLFVAASIGHMSGSAISGRLYDRIEGHRLLALGLAVLGAFALLIPHAWSLSLLFAVFIVIGVAVAVVEVGVNTLVMWEKGAEVGRSMNLLHLAFGVGALITPVLTHVGLWLITSVGAAVAGLVALAALSTASPTAPVSARADQTGSTRKLLVICSVFFLMYVGLEVAFSGWILTYAEEIDFSARDATLVTTVFWITFTSGRVMSATVVNRVRPKVVMIISSVLSLVAALVIVVGSGAPSAVWVGTAVMGLAMAPQFPVMLAYLERRMHLSGTDNSWFVGAAGLGALVFPFVTGQVVDGVGMSVYPWVVLALALLTVGAFAKVNRTFGG